MGQSDPHRHNITNDRAAPELPFEAETAMRQALAEGGHSQFGDIQVEARYSGHQLEAHMKTGETHRAIRELQGTL